ncbi:hypothetical protein FOL47_003803 [Perkinsus chesapeaki]|uniref:Uncharacterized protein n=2 Tax=Alveolata TaxID=33630 RepID=A0A7J6M609_PERCH|nr:hypothetical protein FOL47_003803 [Perkinsus chesapeaki]
MSLTYPPTSVPYYYYSLYPVSLVPWESILSPCLSWSAQEDLINITVYHPKHTHAPPLKYSIAFIKRLVSELANLTDEVHDLWYEYIAESATKLWKSPESDKGYITYQLEDPITLQYDTSGKFIEQGTTGLSQWEAGRYLASWLVANKAVVKGKRVLELGAGSGLVGLVAGKLCGAGEVCLTDGNALVVKALEGNVKANSCCSRVHAARLGWGDDGVGELLGSADVIIGADLTYDPTIVGTLMNTIKLMRADAVCYLCSAVRTQSTWKEFTKQWGQLEVKELLRYPSQWESVVRDEFLAGRCPRPGEMPPTWEEISDWSSNKLAEYLRVAAALVWLENSSRASGQRLAAWVRATQGFSIEGMRQFCDEVYREESDRYRTFGLFAGVHSSIPMKELEELRALGVEEGQRELLTTQQVEDDGSLMEGVRQSSSPSSIGASEESNSIKEETHPPSGEQSMDEGIKEEVEVKVEANEGRCSSGGSGATQRKRGAKRMSHTEAGSPKRRRSSTASTRAPVRRSATAKSSPASGRCSSNGRRASSTASHKVFMVSGIASTVEHTLSGLCNRLGGAKIEDLDRCIERGVTPKLTHVIVPDKNPVVTLKVLYGLCTPTCSIIHEGWIADCRIASEWVPTDEYVVDEWAERPRWTPGRDGPLEKIRIHFSGKVRRLAHANDETRQQAGRMRSAVAEEEAQTAAAAGGLQDTEVVMQDANGADTKRSSPPVGVVRKGRGHGGERTLLEGPVLSSSARRRRLAKGTGDDGAGQERRMPIDDGVTYINSTTLHSKDAWQHDMYSGPMSAGSWVFVRNCPPSVTPQQLYHLFQTTVNSPVVSVKVHRGSIPTALIGFIRRDAAETAEQKLHGRDIDGTMLKVCKVDESVAELDEPEEVDRTSSRPTYVGTSRTPPSQRRKRWSNKGGGGWGGGGGGVRRTPFKGRSTPPSVGRREDQLELPKSARRKKKAETFESLPSLVADDDGVDEDSKEDGSVLPSPVRGWNMSSAGMDGLSWTVELHRQQGDRLGIDVDHQYPEFLLIERVTEGGVVEKFNQDNPTQALMPGDHIVRVNDVTGDSLKMIDCCRRDKRLVWRVVRGR